MRSTGLYVRGVLPWCETMVVACGVLCRQWMLTHVTNTNEARLEMIYMHFPGVLPFMSFVRGEVRVCSLITQFKRCLLHLNYC